MRRFYFFDIREQTCFNTFAPDEEKKIPLFLCSKTAFVCGIYICGGFDNRKT